MGNCDLVVATLVDVSLDHDLTDIRVQVSERIRKLNDLRIVGESIDSIDRVVSEDYTLYAESAAGSVSRATPAVVVGQLVESDSKEPGERLVNRSAAATVGDHMGERLGCEVGSDVGISCSTHEIRKYRGLVPVVEAAERLGIARSCGK